MIRVLWPPSHAGAIIQPQSPALGLLLGHLEPLLPPDALDSFVVHPPAVQPQQPSHPAIPIAPIQARQLHHTGGEPLLIGAGSAVSSELASRHGRHAARTRESAHIHAPQPASSWAGSEVSRGDLLENGIVQGLVSHELLEAAVLALEFLEALGLIEAKPPVLFPPAVIRLLGNFDLLAGFRDTPPLGKQDLSLSQLADNLLCGVALLAHVNPPDTGDHTERVPKILSFSMDRFEGGRSVSCA